MPAYDYKLPPRRRNSSIGCGPIAIGVIVVLFLSFVLGSCAVRNFNTGDVTFKVTDKAAVATSKGGHKYLIYTDHGTFEDTDNLFSAKFSSSDLYGSLHVGQSYRCHYRGIRVPLLSWYKNLISCHPV